MTTGELRDHQARLAALSTELLVTQERERRRIATVLHDAIGQNLLLAVRPGFSGHLPVSGRKPKAKGLP